MDRKRAAWCVAAVVLLGSVGSLAWQKPPAEEPVYLVTDWPPASDNRPYKDFLQEYLNEMAQKGWRLDQTLLSSTNARMLVFRRE